MSTPTPTRTYSRPSETPRSSDERKARLLDHLESEMRSGLLQFASDDRREKPRHPLQYAKGPRVRHAPEGGVTVGGKHYPGGEFIPGAVMAKATPAEKAKVEGRPARGTEARSDLAARLRARRQAPVARPKPTPPGSPDIGSPRTELAARLKATRQAVHSAAPRAESRPKPGPATATPADVAAARATPKIAHPESDEDAARFIAAVRATPVYRAVDAKVAEIAKDSPGGNPTYWSLGKHATGDVLGALEEHGHEAYEQIGWKPARRALHEEILASMLNPKAVAGPGEKPKLVLLMGPPGSGKSTAGQPEAQKLGVEFTTVNADDIKGKLPEYRGWNAAAVHEESGLIAEGPLMHRAVAANHNILMDLTGGNTGKLEQIADGMAAKGYEVHLISVALPAYRSVGRAWDRFTQNAFGHADPTGKTQELGRFVPPKYVHEGIDGKPEETYRVLQEKPYVKSYVAISNDVPRGEKPRVVDRGGR